MPTKYHFTVDSNHPRALQKAAISWETQEPNLEEVFYNTTIDFMPIDKQMLCVSKRPHVIDLSPTDKTPTLPETLNINKIVIMNYTDRCPGPNFKAHGEGYTEYWVQVYHDGTEAMIEELYKQDKVFAEEIGSLLHLPLTTDEFDAQTPGCTQFVISVRDKTFPVPVTEIAIV